MRVKVKILGYVELPNSEAEFRKGYGENIGLFATDIENIIDRLSVEALQIDVENDLLIWLAEGLEVEKILVTDDEWELDLDTVNTDE